MKKREATWWAKADAAGNSVPARVFSAITKIRRLDASRRRQALYNACLYGDGGLAALSGVVSNHEAQPLHFNVVRRNIDTVQAKIAKNRPLPLAITSGGDFRQRRRASKLSRFFAGLFQELDIFDTSELIARDALIFGTGISTSSLDEDGNIVHERVLHWELDVDRLDARYGKPRTVYRSKWVDREVLASLYPKRSDAISEARSKGLESDDPLLDSEDRDGDFVLVVESWRLPAKKGEKGRHVIVINHDDGLLVDEEWSFDYAPFNVLYYGRPLIGFWGDGFAHLLRGIQRELNAVSMRWQEAQYMMGSYLFVEEGSEIDTDHIDNGIGTIVRYRGTPPQFNAPPAANPQSMEYMSALRGQWAFDETGTSALSARSEKPAGIDSAVGLRTLNDIESERFVLFGKAYERYHVTVAWRLFDLAEKTTKSLSVRAETRGKSLEKIDFEKARLDRKEFSLRVFPTSALSNDPAARRSEVMDFVNAGLIPPEVARGLLDMPDLEEFNATADAPRRIVEDIIWRILDADLDTDDPDELSRRKEEVYTFPEPTFDMKLCVSLASQHYLRAKLDRAPEENLSLLMNFVTDSQDALLASEPPPPPPGGPMPMGPGAPPSPMPPQDQAA